MDETELRNVGSAAEQGDAVQSPVGYSPASAGPAHLSGSARYALVVWRAIVTDRAAGGDWWRRNTVHRHNVDVELRESVGTRFGALLAFAVADAYTCVPFRLDSRSSMLRAQRAMVENLHALELTLTPPVNEMPAAAEVPEGGGGRD